MSGFHGSDRTLVCNEWCTSSTLNSFHFRSLNWLQHLFHWFTFLNNCQNSSRANLAYHKMNAGGIEHILQDHTATKEAREAMNDHFLDNIWAGEGISEQCLTHLICIYWVCQLCHSKLLLSVMVQMPSPSMFDGTVNQIASFARTSALNGWASVACSSPMTLAPTH